MSSKNIWNNLTRKFFKQPKHWRILITGLCTVIVAAIIVINFTNFATPLNPIQQQEMEGSPLENAVDVSSEQAAKEEENTTDKEDSQKENESKDSNLNSDLNLLQKKEEQQSNRGKDKEDTKGLNDTREDSGDNKNNSNQTISTDNKTNQQNTNMIKLVNTYEQESEPDYQGYFKTNIQDGQTINERNLNLIITQMNHELQVREIIVSLNDVVVDNFQGRLYLHVGANTIGITVVYETKEGKIITVQRYYTVNVHLSDIKITCNLVNKMVVNQPSIYIQVSATYQDKSIPVDVYCNQSLINEVDDGYLCTLANGSNEVLIHAEKNGISEEIAYTIIYEQPESKYTIQTDLYDHKAELPYLTFYALGYYGEKPLRSLEAQFNGTKITGENGIYEVTLIDGYNRIQLTIGEGEQRFTQTYNILYAAKVVDPDQKEGDIIESPNTGEEGELPSNPEKPEEDPELPENPEEETKEENLPSLYTDLVDGSTITGTTLSFYTMPTDYKGNRIRASGVVVNCNGQVITPVWDDSTKTSYRMELVNGENTIRITVTDQEGNSLTFPFTIYCNTANTGDSLGTVTVSIEATTIGQGYIIPPTQVEIFQGTNAATYVTNLLSEYGYSYVSTGSIDTGFYLAHITGSNLVSNPAIDPTLEQHLVDNGVAYDLTNYNPDSLGEFDFTSGSGWMFSVNGEYPNYGFSDCYPHDGDVIRIRYTLYLGKDIMGGYAMGDGDVANWGDY